jgi:D-glycero-D-manno-heptose 1,7-bisphosphate phosphatase
MNRAIFLDRDGVINSMVYNPEFGLVDSPANPGEFELLPNGAEAVRIFNDLGFLVVVVSNQPGIAKGKFSPALLEAMTAKMLAGLAGGGAQIDSVYYCMHHPDGRVAEYRMVCDCRKPKPGMILRAADDLDIDLSSSYLIGDGFIDIQAGESAGVKTILVYPSSKYNICGELAIRNVQPDHIVESLIEAANVIRSTESVRKVENN